MSPGLMPEAASLMRTSPGPGVGSAMMPTLNTSAAGPCASYHAARILYLPHPLLFETKSQSRCQDLQPLFHTNPFQVVQQAVIACQQALGCALSCAAEGW